MMTQEREVIDLIPLSEHARRLEQVREMVDQVWRSIQQVMSGEVMMKPEDFRDDRTPTQREQDEDIINLMRALDKYTEAHDGRLASGDRGILRDSLARVLKIVRRGF